MFSVKSRQVKSNIFKGLIYKEPEKQMLRVGNAFPPRWTWRFIKKYHALIFYSYIITLLKYKFLL